MSRYPQLLDNLRHFGVPVIEIDGWRERGSSTFNPRGAVNHHTVGPRHGVAPSLGTCVKGRPDVAGPLCNVLLGRDLVARLISDGRANHAGRGGTRGLEGNSSVFGVEVEHTGIFATEGVSDELIHAMARVQAAFAKTGGFGADMVVQHWEWTSRKIDFVKGTLDPGGFRSLVAQYLVWDGPQPPQPPIINPPAPTPEEQEEIDLMSARDDIMGAVVRNRPFVAKLADDGPKGSGLHKGHNWVVSGSGRWRCGEGPKAGAVLQALVFTGQLQPYPAAGPPPIRAEQIIYVPVVPSPIG